MIKIKSNTNKTLSYILFVFAFSFKSGFSQGREIKEIFNASTHSVEVGDSCFLPQYQVGNRWRYDCLCPELDSACNSIYAFLKKNPSISIAFIVHSDPRPIPMGNDMLTTHQANRLKERILEYGDIDSNRIVAIGMGDRQLRIVTKEIHQQYKFLPVGQILDMDFCRTIQEHKKREIAIGFNRRSVVKIIKK